MRTYALMMLLVLASMLGVHAQSAGFVPSFERGNALAYEQDYEAALEAYEQAREYRTSAALEFNTANVYLESGEVGRAMLHYKRAQWLDPGDPDIAANLAQAVEKAKLQTQTSRNWESFAHTLSTNQWLVLLCVAFWLSVAAFFIVPLLSPSRLLRRSLASVGVLGVVACAVALAYWHVERDKGIALDPSTPLKSAPTAQSPQKSSLSAGESLTILSQHNDYFQVENTRGETGWVEAASFAPVLPRE